MSRLEWIKKIMIIVVGSVVAAYGITLALYAGFGGATLAVLWQGISKTFHVSIGMASMIVAIIMIAFAFFYDRSQIHIGTILYQIVYSSCVIYSYQDRLSSLQHQRPKKYVISEYGYAKLFFTGIVA